MRLVDPERLQAGHEAKPSLPYPGRFDTTSELLVARIRTGGPQGVKRPFAPVAGTEKVEDHQAEALEHIARALSAIDHSRHVRSFKRS
jgi:hypothetical protein